MLSFKSFFYKQSHQYSLFTDYFADAKSDCSNVHSDVSLCYSNCFKAKQPLYFHFDGGNTKFSICVVDRASQLSYVNKCLSTETIDSSISSVDNH